MFVLHLIVSNHTLYLVMFNRQKISRRDIYLLRHMVLMFCVFVGGWAPTFSMPIITYYTPINNIIFSSISIWCQLALLINIIDLFLYNHEVRKYLKEFCFRHVRL